VGSHLIRLLSDSKNYRRVIDYSRRKPGTDLPKVEHYPFNPEAIALAEGIDDIFVCLGTTMRKAGSREAFRRVDLDMVVEIARKGRAAGAKRFVVISSIGADPDSNNFYLQTKGRMEEEVKKLGYEYCGIVRPSLLLGKRNEFRFAERMGILLFRFFRFIFVGPLRKYRGIEALAVAKSMVMLAATGKGVVTVESSILKQLADVYRG